MAKKKNNRNRVTSPAERVQAELVEDDFELQPRDEADADGELFDTDLVDEMSEEMKSVGALHGSVIESAPPSSFMNPYMSREEQGMEMQPVVVGPPSYGSPDPLTSAGRLLPLEQHPLRADALPEGHTSAISEDYGEGYGDTLKGADTVRSKANTLTDLERHSVGDFTKEENAEVNATDAAVKLANENDVNLSEVEGTGEDGRVTKDDVANYLSESNGDNA